MNREIKFRAWDKMQKGMIYPDEKLNNLPGNFNINAWCDTESDFSVLMQYTGLKDVNGKDIFEGDICEWNGWGKNISKVEFKNGAFSLSSKYGGKGQPIGERYKWQDMGASGEEELKLKVIGNIYENPELIKK